MERLGLIAGSGELPLLVADEASSKGHEVVALGFPGFTDPNLDSRVNELVWLRLGQIQKAISAFQSRGITRVVMAGKIEKANLMRLWSIRPDRRALRLVLALEDWRDDTILAAIAAELLKVGIVVDEITMWAGKLMAPAGVLTRKTPNKRQWKDIAFGRTMALGIGALDIGQTVVVRNAAVVVVEAIEGTDRAIRRAGEMDIHDTVVVKMAKPGQDMRFDVPGVGPSTIDSMIAAQARVLAIEAGRTLITNSEEMLRKANGAKMSVVGIPATGPVI
ncbi:MAG: UDP-2,3-diacylglucosamine diphosphatase LpxI [Desulfomonile tiedjei]|nr:UDP-2,3-diacylglucosamine diphosphatase LpxI [Desulfomonile tiedjei]